MKKIIHLLYGLPQNILGFFAYIILSRFNIKMQYNEAYVCELPNKYGSISLGMFIFVSDIKNLEVIKHEYGHTKQSMILGLFYLIIIGLPSLLWAAFGDGYRKRTGKSYYDFYCEKWANQLGESNIK